MPRPRDQDTQSDETAPRGVAELDIATGETIGTGPETADTRVADPGDADEPNVSDDARVDLDPQ